MKRVLSAIIYSMRDFYNMKAKRELIFLLLLLMAFSLTITMLPELANADSLTTSLGASNIGNGDTVWFGQYNGIPISWRVLADGSDVRLPVSGAGEALLIPDHILDRTQFNIDDTEENVNQWSGSVAQTWCANFLSNWEDGSAEKAAIKQTSVTEINDKTTEYISEEDIYYAESYYYYGGHHGDYYSAASLNNESFFFLSAKEVDTYFANDDDRKTDDMLWWLRSPSAAFGLGVGDVSADGWVECIYCYGMEGGDLGARPAFNLDLSAILFSSKIPSESNAYKLTLVEANKTVRIQPGEMLIRDSAKSVSVPYVKDGESDHVSLLITNINDTWSDTMGWSSGAEIQYYTTEAVSADTGTVTFSLPNDYDAHKSNWKVWILAKKVNAKHASDCASVPLEITIPDL